MDFIDEFIEEYKKNPCLWKANSQYFKNRNKRQDAYMKLIEVAAKHGEHYNIERTKQKINNLRCAFRHQLKRYTELKNRAETDESYCPKRRYFESLMFLKDEEIPDGKKLKMVDEKETTEEIAAEPAERNVVVIEKRKPKVIITSVVPYETKKQEATKVLRNYRTNSILNVKRTSPPPPPPPPLHPLKSTIAAVPLATSVDQQEKDELEQFERSLNYPSNEFLNVQQTEKDTVNTEAEIVDASNSLETAAGPDYTLNMKKLRKRSSSLSSQVTNDSEQMIISPAKMLKLSQNNSNQNNGSGGNVKLDIEQLFSMACRSIQNNTDDHFANFGKVIAHKLRQMEPTQAIYAEKIIGDVLFQGHMRMLSAAAINSFVRNDSMSSCDESSSNNKK